MYNVQPCEVNVTNKCLEQNSISELVENLKMMADDNSGKGSPGLFTGESDDENVKIVLPE